jgi:hypothetical protein
MTLFFSMDEIYEDIHDLPLIDKAQKTLYKDSKINIIFSMLSLVNLKVRNIN